MLVDKQSDKRAFEGVREEVGCRDVTRSKTNAPIPALVIIYLVTISVMKKWYPDTYPTHK